MKRSNPFLQINPRSLSPVLLTCEHATNRLPFSRGVGAEQRAILASHWGWDIGAWDLTRVLSRRLNAGAVGGRFSRLLIDLNRRADDPTLTRKHAGKVELPWNLGIRPAEIEQRMARYHTPYHSEVDRLIHRRLVRGVRPLLFAVHSFTDVYDGRVRPFQIGVLYERDRKIAHRLGRVLRADGLSVRYNQPYSGMAGMMYSIDRHGLHHRLPCLEIEINQALFDDPSAANKLGAVISRALHELLETSSGA